MSSILTSPELLALLAAGDLLLLPNARAARDLRSAWRAQHPDIEPAGRALAWSQWLGDLFTGLILSGHETRILLNPAQEHDLWRAIIAADPPPNSLGPTDSLATLAASAFQRAADFNALPRLRSASTTDDTQRFAAWTSAFLDRCRKDSLLAGALLHATLADHATAGHLDLPSTLHLIDIAHPTPAQQSLLTALQALGVTITTHDLTADSANQHHTLLAADPREELQLAALWTRQHLQASPSARVAILVPNLAEDRAGLEAALRDTLAPELHAITADLSSTPWEFASGPPLASLNIIATASTLARWALGPLALDELSNLLLSPYLCPPAERDAVARFNAEILSRSRLLRPELSLSTLLFLEGDRNTTNTRDAFRNTTLYTSLRNLQTQLQREGDLSRPRSFAASADLLRDLLRTANWPAHSDAHPLCPSEFAAAQAFDRLLDLLSTLDIAARRIPFAELLTTLTRHAESTPFTPPSTGAPVQVISLADSAGSIFDAVLLLRATDANWPPAEHPHPLLPWPLQRSLQMPGTDPALAAARARAFTADLLTRASTVLFTAAQEDDNGPLRTSPLITELHLPALQLQLPAAPPPVILERASDPAQLPPVSSAEITGGSALLKSMAACHFQAFAAWRLRTISPDTPDLGFNALENGTLVHKVLHLFWAQTRSRDELAALSPDARTTRLNACIDEALARDDLHATSAWDTAYLTVQRQRLLSLLQAWLNVELERGPFTVVDTECKEIIPLGGINFHVRMDRIDMVPGGTVLIDYKTGDAKPTQWNTPRPDEPQLPLYALHLQPEELQGIAFAKLRAGEAMQYVGLQAAKGILPGSGSRNVIEIAGRHAEWHAELHQLAAGFAAGLASVNPKKYPSTCTYCAQRLLCRLDPVALQSLAEDEAPEDTDAEV